VCSKNPISRIMISTMILSWMSHLISDVLSNVRRTSPRTVCLYQLWQQHTQYTNNQNFARF